MNPNRMILLTLPFLIGIGCQPSKTLKLPVYDTPDFTPIWTTRSALQQHPLHTISPFCFLDQNGDSVNNRTFDGKIYVANFFFTVCPSICPKMTNNLLAVQKAFEHDSSVMLLSHTVMPWVDSVSQLHAYAESKGIASNQWRLVTGATKDIYALARQSYFAEEAIGYKRDSSEFLHTEHVLLIDPNRHIRGVYNGTLPLEIDRLMEDIRLLKTE